MFNLYSEAILRNITDMEGAKVGGRNITNLRYADDSVLIAKSQENLQALLSVVTYESESMRLRIIARKTECMVVFKKQVRPQCVIQCKNTKIKQVEKFMYLGFTISSNAKCDQEIKKRIAMSKEVFRKMGTIFKSRNVQFGTKVQVLNAYVWSVLVYGRECWTISKEMEKSLLPVEMWFLRKNVSNFMDREENKRRSLAPGRDR
ncbi:RNA-directed DNA polymerase from mobile element jockey [Elysia marginata]|uniref:RNA-directed DNA polymerase from mobile element jockey n=1 Tax=Elysia marginata TaxID=1093978 RepID=A0AAV4FM61_9GAST|nr:RNA-directed DNA polymerase from mobile element jockey [Elysia marginata]